MKPRDHLYGDIGQHYDLIVDENGDIDDEQLSAEEFERMVRERERHGNDRGTS